ncbi:MAG: proteinsorting protein [Phycisphaerales bacterium]|nr:proteinsorting protein [Phycisphaerales bacterium]
MRNNPIPIDLAATARRRLGVSTPMAILAVALATAAGRLARAAEVTSSASSASPAGANATNDTVHWNTAFPWSDGAAPAAGNTYVIDGETVDTRSVSSTAAAPQAFAGDGLRVTAGKLRLWRNHNSSTSTQVFTAANFVLAGGTLESTAVTGTNQTTFASPVAVTAASTIGLAGGSFTNNLTFTGSLSGSGDLALTMTNSGTGRQITFAAASPGYAGNWTMASAATANKVVSAAAAGAMGAGAATVGNRINLTNSVAGGLGTLASITLTGTGGLVLAAPLSAASMPVAMATTTTVDLGAGASAVGGLTIGTSAVAAGSYTAADLAALGYGGTFAGAGTLTIVPEPASVGVGLVGLLLAGTRRRAVRRS